MIPNPEFGQTLARKRTLRSQGELRRQDQGPRDQPMTRLTIEAEETTSITGSGMIGILLPFEFSHCSRIFNSRNMMFNHLYDKHDDDGKCAAKKRGMILMDPGRRPPTLLMMGGDPKSVGVGCATFRPVLAVEDF